MTAFAGTLTLTRLALRRDRIQLPVWLVGLIAMAMATASSVTGLYDTAQERAAYARTNVTSVVSRVFNGAVTDPGIGAITMVETFGLLAVLTALMSTMAVVRHTRQNEETGRAEMVGAAVVGRYAGLTSALIVAVGANVVLAVLFASALLANDLPAEGSLAAGAALGAVGVAFAGIAAVTAQVSESARGANGLAGSCVGLAYLFRAAGDGLAEPGPSGMAAESAWPSWLSPIGWGQRIGPFHDDDWWILAVYAAFFAGLVAVAFVLTAHRDVGTGMMPVRSGPATASRGLLSSVGLAWRLQRGVLIGWAAGMAVMGAAFGAVGHDAEEMLGGSDDLTDLIGRLGGGGSLIDVYFSAMMGILGTVIAGYTVQALLRMRAEETGPLESVLATAVSRPRWMSGHIACAVLGTVVLLLLTGLSTGLAYGIATGTMSDLPGLMAAALVQAPATLALAGFVIVMLGLLPRWSVALSWAGLTVCLVIKQIGPILELPQAVMNISPFSHVPALPAGDVTVVPIVVLLSAAIALGALGLRAFRRRDLAY
ncbi:ABC transporter permease [Actinomadura alba]|uniref:Anibiotic ABC transporter n=1 Tax=Actinomadura alba TaxID=406431 RepID=A0ABR7LMD9_9ACTN|nr:anibiotic ABC transporter [Actinomadura alba]MBC6465994.1 anibiotic ABC transporter [Actinomadura alba]